MNALQPWPVLHQPMEQSTGHAGPGDLPIPLAHHLAAEGCEADPFSQALAVHFPAQYADLDQPNQMVFGAVGREGAAAQLSPVGPVGQFVAAQGPMLKRGVEAPAKGQAAHRPTGAP